MNISRAICAVVACLGFSCNLFDPSLEDLVKNKSIKWKTESSIHYEYYFESGSWADLNIDSIEVRQESAFTRIGEVTGIKDYSKKISMFILEDREKLKLLIEQNTNGKAFSKINAVCCVANRGTRALGPHEVLHVIARNSWVRLKNGLTKVLQSIRTTNGGGIS